MDRTAEDFGYHLGTLWPLIGAHGLQLIARAWCRAVGRGEMVPVLQGFEVATGRRDVCMVLPDRRTA